MIGIWTLGQVNRNFRRTSLSALELMKDSKNVVNVGNEVYDGVMDIILKFVPSFSSERSVSRD